MCFEIIETRSLGTTLGDQSGFILGYIAFFVALSHKNKLVGDRHDAWWLIDELPHSHLLELV